jgi:hypothetical protein
MPKQRQYLLILLAVIVLGGAGYYWFVVKGDALPPVDTTATTPTTPGADTTATTPTTPTTPATPTDQSKELQKAAAEVGAADDSPVVSKAMSDGTASGNTAYAVKVAKIVANIAQKHGLSFEVQVQLVPGIGGMTTNAQQESAYKSKVVGAVMRMKIADATTQDQWASNTVVVRKQSLTSFLSLLSRLLPNSTRSVSIIGQDDTLLGIGDASPKQRAKVTVYPVTASTGAATGATTPDPTATTPPATDSSGATVPTTSGDSSASAM